jgi:amino acid adenylation domain-containing protein
MTVCFALTNELIDQLNSFSEENQIDIQATLRAGFAILLHLVLNQVDFKIINSSSPNNDDAFSDLQGWLISFTNELTVKQLLDGMRKPPIKSLMMPANPCKVFFSYNFSTDTDAYPSDSLWLDFHGNTTTLEGKFNSNGDLYTDKDLELLASRFSIILQGMLTSPDQNCSKIPLLSSAERQQLLVEWNQSKVDYPKDVCLHTLIEQQVERTPDNVALSMGGTRITFRELNDEANQFSHYLIGKGIGPGSLIGLFSDPDPHKLSVILGILKTGAAFVCLDPVYPEDKLKFIADECELSGLITTSKLKERFPSHVKTILLLDDTHVINVQPVKNPSLQLSPEAQAFIIYTSGSTGLPKGVIYTHKGLISRFHSTWAFCPTGNEEVYSQTSPLSSIDLIDEIYPPLIRGFRVEMIPMETVRDPHLLVASLEAAAVTRLVLVPSLLRTILSINTDIAQKLRALKVVLIGGEPLTYALVDLFYQKLPNVQLINFYGLTEGDGSFYPVHPDKKVSFAPPIGRPVANAKIYILGSTMEPVPVGMSGEIYIANEGMAKAYYKRHELNVERFLPNPFNGFSEIKLYKTGDRGRYLSDGNIEYLGRIDRMVKIRSFRVELGEVEAAINSHPAVQDCIAVTIDSSAKKEDALTREPRLVGYVVLKQQHGTSADDIKKYLRSKLPEYAVPSAIVIINSFPLSPNGKIDVSALPNPEKISHEVDNHFVYPRNTIEMQLVEMWEKILHTNPISVEDNFFEIGGDSLAAVDLFLQIEKDFQKDLPISALIQAPTIAQLATLIRQDVNAHRWSSLVPIQTQGGKPPLFCIHADGGVFMYNQFVEFLGPDQPIFGLQAKGLLSTHDTPHNDLKKMAADYIQEMRTVQPTGPYRLCAFSMGGLVAFEMAFQLKALGEEVALLGLFDAYCPGFPKRKPGINFAQLKISIHAGELSRYNYLQKLDYIMRRIRHRLRVIQSSCFGWFVVAFQLPMPHSIRYDFVRQIIEEAAENYEPGHYPGKLTIFRAKIQPEGIIPDPYLGWDGHADAIEIVDVEGTHNSIMKRPDVGNLLKYVRGYLGIAAGSILEF